MTLLLANIFGWIVAHWRLVAGAVGVVFLVIVFGLAYRSCNKPQMELTEQEKQEVKEQIANGETTKLKEKLVEFETKEKVIDETVANAQAEKWAAIQESKEKWANANISDLQAEFDRRMNE